MDEIAHKEYRIKKADVVFYPDTRVQHDPGKDGKGRNSRRHHGDDGRNEVKDYVDDMITMVEDANSQLEIQDSPLRFRIHREEDEVFIDIIITDRKGTVLAVREKNITHEKFLEAVDHICGREGLLFDQLG
ncbi:MAG: hypothetical protein CVV44_09890 [Spirochaetae bacterium HGW-Spirochaetae-1]|jgi:uncharacterized FlaG/YvyC family protein|nr:MAG: hypothetical protein CVV44_09890 [Spirochaetae bacterium HGW-Spirochaetae-1]